MPRIPTYTSNANITTAASSPRVSGNPAGKVWGEVTGIGHALYQIGQKFRKAQQNQEYVSSFINAKKNVFSILNEAQQDNNLDGFVDRYNKRIDDVRNQISSSITDSIAKQEFLNDFDNFAIYRSNDINRLYRSKVIQQGKLVSQQLDTDFAQNYLNATSSQEKKSLVEAYLKRKDDLYQRGSITDKERKNVIDSISELIVNQAIANNPKQAPQLFKNGEFDYLKKKNPELYNKLKRRADSSLREYRQEANAKLIDKFNKGLLTEADIAEASVNGDLSYGQVDKWKTRLGKVRIQLERGHPSDPDEYNKLFKEITTGNLNTQQAKEKLVESFDNQDLSFYDLGKLSSFVDHISTLSPRERSNVKTYANVLNYLTDSPDDRKELFKQLSDGVMGGDTSNKLIQEIIKNHQLNTESKVKGVIKEVHKEIAKSSLKSDKDLEKTKHNFIRGFVSNLLGGAYGGLLGIGELFMPLTPLSINPVGAAMVKKGMEKAKEYFVKKPIEANKPTNKVEEIGYQFAQGLGSLGITLPIDTFTGGATKAALASRVLPKVASILSKLPDFAIGMAERRILKEAESRGNVVKKTAKMFTGGAESLSWGVLYGKATRFIIPTMGALGTGESAYDAIKQGRLPTKEELISGGMTGIGMGILFTLIPYLRAGTEIGKEKVILTKAEKDITDFINKGDLEGVKNTLDELSNNENLRPEIRDAIKTAKDGAENINTPETSSQPQKQPSTQATTPQISKEGGKAVSEKTETPVGKEFLPVRTNKKRWLFGKVADSTTVGEIAPNIDKRIANVPVNVLKKSDFPKEELEVDGYHFKPNLSVGIVLSKDLIENGVLTPKGENVFRHEIGHRLYELNPTIYNKLVKKASWLMNRKGITDVGGYLDNNGEIFARLYEQMNTKEPSFFEKKRGYWGKEDLSKLKSIYNQIIEPSPTPVKTGAGGIAKAQEARKAKLLTKVKPQIDKLLEKGYKPKVVKVIDKKKMKALEEELNMLKKIAPIGNKQHPDTIRLQEVKELLSKPITKEAFRLEKPDGVFVDVNKTEFEYAKSQPLSPTTNKLIEEAKGKSLEEFVNKQEPLFFGSGTKFTGHIARAGLSATVDKRVAERFANRFKTPVINEIFLKPNAKIIKFEDLPNEFRSFPEGIDTIEKAALYAKSKGFDAIDMRGALGNINPEVEIRIFNPDIILTKSQLTKIWEEANKPEGKSTQAVKPQPEEKVKAFKGKIGEIIPEHTEKQPKFTRKSDIIKFLGEKLNVPIRRGHFRGKASGIYKETPDIIRFKSGDIPVISHEIGHFLEDNYSDLAKLIKTSSELPSLDYEPSKARSSEGFGEFLRFYITEPRKASQKAPQFHKDFADWLDNNSEVKDILHTAREDFQNWLEMPSVMKVKSQISFAPSKKGFNLQQTINNLRVAITDDLFPIENFVKIAKKKGIKIDDDENPYILARLFRGWVGKANHWLEHKTFNTKLELTGKGLKEILKPAEKNLENLDTYLVAKRALELNKANKKTGISTKDAQTAIKELENKYPNFSKIAQEIYDYQDRLLDYAQENGLISSELRGKLKKYKNYVPFYRVMEELQQQGYLGEKFANITSPIKKIKGSEREIISPIESIMKNTYAILNASDRNSVARAVVELAKQHKDLERMVEKISTPMAKVATIKPKDIFDKNIIEELLLDEEDLDKAIDIFRPSFYTPKDSIITVLNEGKKEFYQVDPDLYKALMNLDEEEASMLIKILSFPARWLRAGATTFSPEFLVRNPLRDQRSAYIYSKFGYLPIRDFARGLFSLAKKDDLYWQWVRSGGEHSMLVSMDRNYFKKNLQELFGKNWKKAINPMEWLRALSELGEAATRLGEFKAGVKKGSSLKTAAFSSREVTLDFARKGSKIKNANRIIAFLNANIQGLNRPFRAFQEAPARTFWKIMTGITLRSIILYFLNRNDKRYQELPRWEKDLFWIIRIPVSKKIAPSGEILFRYPKPFEVGIMFGSVPERILEYIDKTDPVALDKLGETILRGINIDLIPTALKPIIENMTNYSFFRQRPLESESIKRLLPSYRYYEFTHETAKKVGKLLNISPVKMENLVRGYSGALGSLTLDLMDTVITGGKRKLPLTIETTPLIRGFIAREPVGSLSKSVNDFYDNYKKITEQYMTYNALNKQGKKEEADKIHKKNPKLSSFYHQFYSTARVLSDYRKRINKILGSNKDKETKLKEIRKLGLEMRETAEKANRSYYE